MRRLRPRGAARLRPGAPPLLERPPAMFRKPNCARCMQAGLRYVTSMYSEYFNSFGDEQGFNDIRDDERRRAKHHQRGDGTLHAMAISSMASRWAESAEEHRPKLVKLDEEAISSSRTVHVDPSTYRVAEAPTHPKKVGFKISDLTNSRVPSEEYL